MEIDPELVVPDPTLSIGEGAIAPWAQSASDYYDQLIQAIAERYDVDLDTPWEDLPEQSRDFFLYGTNGDRVQVTYRNRFGRRRSYGATFDGILPNLERRYRETESELAREKIEEYMTLRPCPDCKGARLRPESRAVLIEGTAIHEFTALSARRALEWVDQLELSEHDQRISRLVLREISERLRFLDNVGVGYLSMNRAASTLSGGEAQRIRLATQIGSSLVGRAVHPRRAVDRAAPARQQQADRRRSSGCGTSATRCSWSSTTRARCGPRTISSTWARAPASTAVTSWRRARPTTSPRSRSRSPASSWRGRARSRPRAGAGSRRGAWRSWAPPSTTSRTST